jgi:hypothetical protein
VADLDRQASVGILPALLGPVAHQFAFSATEPARHLDVDVEVEVATAATSTHREPAARDEQHLSRLDPRGDVDLVFAAP